MDFYPVSSMMQPSQASGHLQSPVKTNGMDIKRRPTNEGVKQQTVFSIFNPSCDTSHAVAGLKFEKERLFIEPIASDGSLEAYSEHTELMSWH